MRDHAAASSRRRATTPRASAGNPPAAPSGRAYRLARPRASRARLLGPNRLDIWTIHGGLLTGALKALDLSTRNSAAVRRSASSERRPRKHGHERIRQDRLRVAVRARGQSLVVFVGADIKSAPSATAPVRRSRGADPRRGKSANSREARAPLWIFFRRRASTPRACWSSAWAGQGIGGRLSDARRLHFRQDPAAKQVRSHSRRPAGVGRRRRSRFHARPSASRLSFRQVQDRKKNGDDAAPTTDFAIGSAMLKARARPR